MAVIKHFEEIKVSVSSKRMFKAVMVEPYTYLPKIMPAAIKSIDLLHGNGGVGTIMQINSPDGCATPFSKQRVNVIDKENCTTKFSLIEGPELGDNLESVDFEIKFEESSDGGCVIKETCVYNAKGGVILKREDIETDDDRVKAFYTAIEDYLVANPNVCV